MIGVFDSGIGGLTVLKALREKLPEHSFIYFGDTARTPYGNKSPEAVLRYGREDAALLLREGVEILVIACNTASSVAYEALKKEFNVPIFEVIHPAVREAVKTSKSGLIGVIGTAATIGSGVYQKLLKENPSVKEVFTRACPLFVPLVEEGWENEEETKQIVKKYLNQLKLRGIDTLILGCTHYPLLKGLIGDFMGPDVRLVDSAQAVAIEVAAFLDGDAELGRRIKKEKSARILVSDKTKRMEEIARIWLGDLKIELA